MIEVHFTEDITKGPDHKVSLVPNEMKSWLKRRHHNKSFRR